tara:strand:+ start:1282 stop:1419 length:138 start_codon:yes stop_codon:yes gene_type:complete
MDRINNSFSFSLFSIDKAHPMALIFFAEDYFDSNTSFDVEHYDHS